MRTDLASPKKSLFLMWDATVYDAHRYQITSSTRKFVFIVHFIKLKVRSFFNCCLLSTTVHLVINYCPSFTSSLRLCEYSIYASLYPTVFWLTDNTPISVWCLSVYLSMYLSMYLSIDLSIYLPIYLSIDLSIFR